MGGGHFFLALQNTHTPPSRCARSAQRDRLRPPGCVPHRRARCEVHRDRASCCVPHRRAHRLPERERCCLVSLLRSAWHRLGSPSCGFTPRVLQRSEAPASATPVAVPPRGTPSTAPVLRPTAERPQAALRRLRPRGALAPTARVVSSCRGLSVSHDSRTERPVCCPSLEFIPPSGDTPASRQGPRSAQHPLCAPLSEGGAHRVHGSWFAW